MGGTSFNLLAADHYIIRGLAFIIGIVIVDVGVSFFLLGLSLFDSSVLSVAFGDTPLFMCVGLAD